MNLYILKKLTLENFSKVNGSIQVLELREMKNFYLRRLYYIYDVPSNSYRGFHAHKKLKQIFICLQGSFHLKVTDGTYTDSVDLIPHDAYYLPSGYWRELSNFTPRTICLVLATEHYEKSDYIYDFKEFLKWKSNE